MRKEDQTLSDTEPLRMQVRAASFRSWGVVGGGGMTAFPRAALAVQSPAPGYILQSFSGKFSVMRWSG